MVSHRAAPVQGQNPTALRLPPNAHTPPNPGRPAGFLDLGAWATLWTAAFRDDPWVRDSATLGRRETSGESDMSERDWKEEQREVLARLFDAVFGRREASQEEMGRDVHWPGRASRRPDDGDE